MAGPRGEALGVVKGAFEHRFGAAGHAREGVAGRVGAGLAAAEHAAKQARPEIWAVLQIAGARRGRIEIGAARRLGDGVVERAEAVDQAELAGGAAGPDPALADLVDALRAEPPGAGDQGDEAAVGRLDAHLQQPVGLGRGAAQQVRLARERRRPHPVGADAEPLQRAFEARQDGEHADRAGDRRGLGEDDVARGCDPIAARGRDRAHRDDDRDAARLGHQHGAADPLRAGDRAAR